MYAVVLVAVLALTGFIFSTAYALNGNDDVGFSIIKLVFGSEHIQLAYAVVIIGVSIRIISSMFKGIKFNPALALSSFLLAGTVGAHFVANNLAHITSDATPVAAFGIISTQIVYIFGQDWVAKKVGVHNVVAKGLKKAGDAVGGTTP